MKNVTPIDFRQRKIVDANMKHLVQTICDADVTLAVGKVVVENPYGPQEPEFKWY